MPSTTPTSPLSATSSAADSAATAPPRVGAVVAIGGGSGLSVLLRGLKHHVTAGGLASLTGVVTVADDGGSSGRLRRDFGMPAPGDIRSCIVALADDEALLARLFQYRFTDGEGLGGHSFGNLFLAALAAVTGDFYQAIVESEHILSVRGRILPATLASVHLMGVGASGREYHGESAVGRAREPLASLALEPAGSPAFPPAVAAIRDADLVVLGPGSLYTSILPNLLLPGLRDAVAETRARVVLLMNLMTQPGETDDMDALAHLAAVQRWAGAGLVDVVLVNGTLPGLALLDRYGQEGALPVVVDERALAAQGVEVVVADLLEDGPLIRHDPAKLAQVLLALARAPRREGAARGSER
jgi:uncharacterized cofD-like protein